MTQQHELDRMVPLVHELSDGSISYNAIIEAFQSFQVLCVADARNVATKAGQTAIVSFITLIARMGVQVYLDMPETSVVDSQPPLRGHLLKEGLIDLGNDLIPGSKISGDCPDKLDLAFVFGDTPYAQTTDVLSWRLMGNQWAGSIRPIQRVSRPWQGVWPIGAMTSAAIAAGEVFKAVVRTLQTYPHDLQSLLASPSYDASWDFGNFCQFPEKVECGSVDFVSGGAINQALLYALFRIPGLNFRGRIFDDDITANTNINRNMLTRRSDIGKSKVGVVSAFDIKRLVGIPERMIDGALVRHRPLADSVLVGTDDIPARWQVQKESLGWVGIGGTSHFGTLSSSHKSGEPCGGCLHWKDDLIANQVVPTVSFVSFWAGLSLAVRFLRYCAGYSYSAKEQALWLVPLRMDAPNPAFWSPVAARNDCPVHCIASRSHGVQRKVVTQGLPGSC